MGQIKDTVIKDTVIRETPNCPLKKFETTKIDPASRLHEHLA